jgi:hypothetical protein
MLYNLLLWCSTIAWAVGCWSLRQAEGRAAILWVSAACGAMVMAYALAFSLRRARPLEPDPGRLAEMAERIDHGGLELYDTADVFRPFPVLGEIRLWAHAIEPKDLTGRCSNILAGRLGDVEVLVADVATAASGKDRPASEETVVIFPGAAAGLPPFQLEAARRFSRRLLRGNVEFDPAEALDDEARRQVEAFARNYRLTLFEMKDEDAVRQVFALDTLAYLAARPDWLASVQGGHLVLSRYKRKFADEERTALLAEADALRQQLTQPPTTRRVVVPAPPPGGVRAADVLWPLWSAPLLAGICAFFAGLTGLLAGIPGALFAGRLKEWMLEGCALGTAYGPLVLTVLLTIAGMFSNKKPPVGAAPEEAFGAAEVG